MAVCGVPMRLFGRSELRMHRRGAPERLRERPASAPAAPEQTEFLWITGGAPKNVEKNKKNRKPEKPRYLKYLVVGT